MFSTTCCILSGWTADRTNIRVATSRLYSEMVARRSSFVRSHWNARQRSGQYREFSWKANIRYIYEHVQHYSNLTTDLIHAGGCMSGVLLWFFILILSLIRIIMFLMQHLCWWFVFSLVYCNMYKASQKCLRFSWHNIAPCCSPQNV